ncbi:hypothetical protein GJR88_03866 [Dietzia sp. DQ12-45-1b]|nr:hypothetical protein GJR88_03866 [Dietzia sp. DQ12-45-1b]
MLAGTPSVPALVALVALASSAPGRDVAPAGDLIARRP